MNIQRTSYFSFISDFSLTVSSSIVMVALVILRARKHLPTIGKMSERLTFTILFVPAALAFVLGFFRLFAILSTKAAKDALDETAQKRASQSRRSVPPAPPNKITSPEDILKESGDKNLGKHSRVAGSPDESLNPLIDLAPRSASPIRLNIPNQSDIDEKLPLLPQKESLASPSHDDCMKVWEEKLASDNRTTHFTTMSLWNESEYKGCIPLLPENIEHNNYTNILPGPLNCLGVSDKLHPETGYYNGNVVEWGPYRLAIVQGPKPHLNSPATEVENLRRFFTHAKGFGVIYQCTAFEEDGREKCFPYYIDGQLALKRGHEVTSHLIRQVPDRVQERTLTVSFPDASVCSFKLMELVDWKDHSDYPVETLVDLVKQMDFSETPIFHCSAGVGRSGTLAATALIYLMLQSEPQKYAQMTPLKLAEEAVLHIRKYRPMAVQTASQFEVVANAAYLLKRETSQGVAPLLSHPRLNVRHAAPQSIPTPSFSTHSDPLTRAVMAQPALPVPAAGGTE
jgi:protein tyrosine phosphatase